MRAEILIAVICSLLTILVLILTDYARRAGRDDVGLSLIRTEDEPDELAAKRPTDPIDEALAATTDRAEQDALLDDRLQAMGGAG